MPDDQEPQRDEDEAREVLTRGTSFGRYRIVRRLGRGGMGAVYEACHVELDKRVALKTLHPEVARESSSRARFLQEGRAASRIHHPHVVDVMDVGVHEGTPFLVMELLQGEDLARRLAREGRLAPAEAASLLLPVIAAIGVAHEERIVHRDLKPANIFLARTRAGHLVPKVLDFGISKVSDPQRSGSLTTSETILGTPRYMSPEQASESKHVGPASDQYALGVVLYECLTGRPPFEGRSLMAVLSAIGLGRFPAPRELRPELPEGLEIVVLRAMRHDPAERYATVYEMGRALLPFATDAVRAHWEETFLRGAHAHPPPALGGAEVAETLPAPVGPLPHGLAAPAATLSPRAKPAPAAGTAPPSTAQRFARVALVASLAGVGAVALRAVNAARSPPNPGVASPAHAREIPAPAPSAEPPLAVAQPLDAGGVDALGSDGSNADGGAPTRALARADGTARGGRHRARRGQESPARAPPSLPEAAPRPPPPTPENANHAPIID